MKRIFTLIAVALTICSAQAAEDLTLNVSETVPFGDWGFDNSTAPTLNVSNWAAGGGWKFASALSQNDYCGVDFTMEPTVGAHVTFTITYEGGETQSLDIPEGTTSIKTDFAFNGGITQIGFSHGDWEGGADPAVISITSAVVKAHSKGEVTELNFADLNPGEDTSLKDDANQTITLNRYSTYPAWYFDPAFSSDDYEKVVITFAEPIPDEGIQLNAESDTDGWSGTQIAGLTKGASKVTAYFSAKPGVNIKSIGFYYSWNSKQGTDDQTTLKIASAKLVKKAGSGSSINTIQAVSSNENGTIYMLSGQPVSSPVRGINIINGKKVIKH